MRLLDIGTYLTPATSAGTFGGRDLSNADLAELYAYPSLADEPWIRANFVSSIDGSVSSDGTSGGLGTPSDKQVFGVLRELADAVLVGAGTVRAENYGGVRLTPEQQQRRVERGRAPIPPIVVVTASARLDPSSRIVTDTEVPPIVVTTTSAPEPATRALQDAGVVVVALDEDTVTTGGLLGALRERGLFGILCEGGPGLFGQLVTDGAIDELCSTTSPMLVSGSAGRIAHADTGTAATMVRAHVLSDDDGTLLTRWVRPGVRAASEHPDRK